MIALMLPFQKSDAFGIPLDISEGMGIDILSTGLFEKDEDSASKHPEEPKKTLGEFMGRYSFP